MKIFFTAILIGIFCCKGCVASEAETNLQKKLFEHYNPSVRPVRNPNDAITVEFQLSLQQVIDLDEKNQLLTTSLYMTNTWNDWHFQWNSTEYENISSIRVPAKYVWKPDIYVYNSAVDSFDSLLPTNAIIYSDGTVSWLPPGIFRTTCDINIAYFPFDEQKCDLKFGAWTHQLSMIDLTLSANGTADVSAYIESGEWQFVAMTGEVHRVKYDCCKDPFVDATYTIHIKRKSTFYIYNLIIPCIFVCSLAILMFIFPADAGERMTLGITVLLAMVVFLQLLGDTLPPTGTIPILGKYFLFSVVMVSLSVIASVISMSFHHSNPSNTDKMPLWVELIFLNILPKILRMRMPKKFTENLETKDEKNGYEGVPLVRVGERLGGWQNELHGNKDPETSLMMQLRHSEKQLAKMCGDLHDIVTHVREADEEDLISEKWKFAARVLDRLCVFMFSLFFVCTTVFTVVIVPTPEA